MMEEPPAWFKSFCICELIVQLPFFPVAAYAFWKGIIFYGAEKGGYCFHNCLSVCLFTLQHGTKAACFDLLTRHLVTFDWHIVLWNRWHDISYRRGSRGGRGPPPVNSQLCGPNCPCWRDSECAKSRSSPSRKFGIRTCPRFLR